MLLDVKMDIEKSSTRHQKLEKQTIKEEMLETEDNPYVHEDEQIVECIKKEIKIEALDVGSFADDYDLKDRNFNSDQDGCTEEPVQFVSRTKKKKVLELFKCEHPNCGKSFETNDKLTYHYVDHGYMKPFKCNQTGCTISFKTRGELNKHMRVHSNERPFKCEQTGCTRSFKSKGELNIHMRVHSDERLFKCSYGNCNKAFKAGYKLKKHILQHSDGKIFKCTYKNCNEAFKERSDYKSHQTIHPPEKIACTYPGCNAVLQICSYNKHMQMHNFGRQYRCTFNKCTASFYRNTHLNRHMRMHTGEKFLCNYPGCDKSFSSKDWMAKHKKKHSRRIDSNSHETFEESIAKWDQKEISCKQGLQNNGEFKNEQQWSTCENTFSDDNQFQESVEYCEKYKNFEFVELNHIKSEDSVDVKSEFENSCE